MRRPPTAGRRGARLLGAVVVALLVAAGAPAGPAPAQEAEDPAVTFRGIDVVPWVPRDGTWTMELALTGAPADGQVAAAIYDHVPSRSAYYEAVFGQVRGERKAFIPRIDLAEVPRDGDTHSVQLAVTLLSESDDQPGWKFLSDGLAEPGVYPIVVEVLDAEERTVGRTVVFLTRVASGDEEEADDPPLLVAPVLPLSGPPSIQPDGASEMPAGAVARTDALADGLRRAGDLPATLAPRPETIEALDREPGGDAALAALRTEVRGRQVIDGPYVDVPVSAWVDAGLGDELRRQRERGNTVLNGWLGGADSSTFLALDGLGAPAVAALWDVGVRTVVLGPDTVDPATPTSQPFTLASGNGRSMRGIAGDDGLANALVRNHDPVRDRAGLAAELALVAAEDDGVRGVAIVAPDGWPATAADLAGVAEVLTHADAPVTAATVETLASAVPTDGPRMLRPVAPVELGDQPSLLAYARARLAAFVSMTEPGNPEVTALDQRLLLSGSASLDPPVRTGYVDSVLATLTTRLTSVEAPGRQTVTLTSRDGVVPLNLHNDLDHPVKVRIDLDADTGIDFPGEGESRVEVLEPGTTEVRIPVRARAPGDTPIDITILTPDGSQQLDQVRYTIRSTAISGLGLVLSIGAAAFLLGWWFRHWRRTRRDRRAAAAL